MRLALGFPGMKLRVIEGGAKNPKNNFVETVKVDGADGKRWHVQWVEIVAPTVGAGGAAVIAFKIIVRALTLAH